MAFGIEMDTTRDSCQRTLGKGPRKDSQNGSTRTTTYDRQVVKGLAIGTGSAEQWCIQLLVLIVVMIVVLSSATADSSGIVMMVGVSNNKYGAHKGLTENG